MFRVAIIGTGNIGMDLLMKLLKFSNVEIAAFVGRRASTKVIPAGVKYCENGIEFFIDNPGCCDLVFDCTDAYSAKVHSKVFASQGIKVIDMTPSMVGKMCIPNVNCQLLNDELNINMVTCGGQVSIPLIDYFKCKLNSIRYVEVVTQISADSAGMATRENIDKYIETTENAIKEFTRIPNCKVILNINPHETTMMQTTLYIKAHRTETDFSDFDKFICKIREYIPNYSVGLEPSWTPTGILMVSVVIVGSGDFLSRYAGNLDAINCAAIHVLKNCIRQNCQEPQTPLDIDPVSDT